jgi:hypothetical protein
MQVVFFDFADAVGEGRGELPDAVTFGESMYERTKLHVVLQ